MELSLLLCCCTALVLTGYWMLFNFYRERTGAVKYDLQLLVMAFKQTVCISEIVAWFTPQSKIETGPHNDKQISWTGQQWSDLELCVWLRRPLWMEWGFLDNSTCIQNVSLLFPSGVLVCRLFSGRKQVIRSQAGLDEVTVCKLCFCRKWG